MQVERDIRVMTADPDVEVNLLTLKISELAQMGKLDTSILAHVKKQKHHHFKMR